MSFDDGMASVTARLVDRARFPEYALERRVDIVPTPFLPCGALRR